MRTLAGLVVVLAGAVGCDGGALGVCGTPDAVAMEEVEAFWLPINSLRFGVSGRVIDGDVCVGLVWELGEVPAPGQAICDEVGVAGPYAVVRPAVDGACGPVWDYGPSADTTIEYYGGCIIPDLEGAQHRVMIGADLASPLFTGHVSFDVE
jgi:hypothetical protein